MIGYLLFSYTNTINNFKISGGKNNINFKYIPEKPVKGKCTLSNGSNVSCPTRWNYKDTLTNIGDIWDPGKYNDPYKFISACEYEFRDKCGSTSNAGECLDCVGENQSNLDKMCGPYNNSFDSLCSHVPYSPVSQCKPSTPNGLPTDQPTDYAYAPPKWNWVIGTCKGENCNSIESNKDAKDHGTDMIVNYVGAYQFDVNKQKWVLREDSSFNINGSLTPQNIMDTNPIDSWLPGPLPGGSANWGEGYYPAGAEGVGPPAFAFILSVDRIFNVAWYILNQAALNRGPETQMANECSDCMNKHGYNENTTKEILSAHNTWASSRSGEWDILESPSFRGDDPDDPDYRRLYANTDSNEGSNGFSLHHGVGSDRKQSGGWGTLKYFMGDEWKNSANVINPRVFFTVIDRNGTTIYQIPTGEGAKNYWNGISRKSALKELDATPNSKPVTGKCDETNNFCAVFMPSCLAKSGEQINLCENMCSENGIETNFCGNLDLSLVDTSNTWGSSIPKSVSNMGGSWTTEMQTDVQNYDDLCTCAQLSGQKNSCTGQHDNPCLNWNTPGKDGGCYPPVNSKCTGNFCRIP